MSALKIETFGAVDERSLKQLGRFMDAAGAEQRVLAGPEIIGVTEVHRSL